MGHRSPQNLSMSYSFFATFIFLIGCGSPQKEYNKLITSKGYIPFSMPLASTGVGTLLKGQPRELRVVTRPERCFLEEADGRPTELRWVTDTDLPSQYQEITVDFNVDLSTMMAAGSPGVNINLHYDRAKKVDIKFGGASVEYLDELAFFEYYKSDSFPSLCKDFMLKYPFISQALRVETMEFTFRDENGVKIRLEPQGLSDIVDIGVDVSWRIINGESLIVTTPKYIGYQLARLRPEDQGLISLVASEVKNNKYVFREIKSMMRALSPKMARLAESY